METGEEKTEEEVKHFHRYCDCDADSVDSSESDLEMLEMTSEEDMSFESTFERDILLNFTDLTCHQVFNHTYFKLFTQKLNSNITND